MKLLIVESPTKTKSVSKYLGKDFKVMATMGHVQDLPKSKMGVEMTGRDKFGLEYQVVEGKDEVVSKLKQAAKKAKKVILATDPDREGEAIAWHIAGLLSGEKGKIGAKFLRVVFHSITKEALLEAMKAPKRIDMDLVDAQQARRVLDRLVGYSLSPLLWRKVRKGLSAGRVQSVAVRLVVEREREIEAFKAEEYWPIRVKVARKGKTKGGSFWVDLMKIEGKKAEVKNKKQARATEALLKAAKYWVEEVILKERVARPQPPFKTSTLQQAAANVLSWSAKKTMSVAQKLYERGKITYHRTDSLNLAASAVETIRQLIKAEWGEKYLPASVRYYKTSGKVVAQEAHEAIRPTRVEKGPDGFKARGRMAADQEKLYGLIWRRTVACQMSEAVYDMTKVMVEARSKKRVCGLQAIGEIEKFAGWRKLYRKENQGLLLPKVEKGEELDYREIKLEQKFTQPPARYNDASLVRELEKRGIGRPSTYAPTISTIVARRYVERQERWFQPTTIGEAVTQFLMKNFAEEMDYAFTAGMETKLDEIAKGNLAWMKMMGVFYRPFKIKVKEVGEKSERVKIQTEATGKKCPECKKGEVIIREGRFGRFYGCSNYSVAEINCGYTAPLVEYVRGAKCEKCGARVVVKKTRTGREFYGCKKYPKCDWASWKRPKTGKEKDSEEAEKT